MNPTESKAMERSIPAYMRVLNTSTAPSASLCTILNPLTIKPYNAPIPRAYTIASAPLPPSSPATRTSRQATPSGYGRASSTMKRRLRAMVNIVPNNPPRSAIARVGNHSISTQIPITNIAGTVKITPAARDSPALAMVCTALFSRILTSLNKARRMSIDITAAGMLAETVIPA